MRELFIGILFFIAGCIFPGICIVRNIQFNQQESSPNVSLMVGGVKVGEAKAEAVIICNEPVSIVKSKELTPREMIKKLYDMGYRIDNNHLVCIQKVVVKMSDILN